MRSFSDGWRIHPESIYLRIELEMSHDQHENDMAEK